MRRFLSEFLVGFKRLGQAWFVGFLCGLAAFIAVCGVRYFPLWSLGVSLVFLPFQLDDLKKLWGERKILALTARITLLTGVSSLVVGLMALASDFVPHFDAFEIWACCVCVGVCVLSAPYWYLRRVEWFDGPPPGACQDANAL